MNESDDSSDSPSNYTRIRVEPASACVGAEISGVDLADVDDETFEEIHHAWLEHQVLFFRDQHITPSQQAAFAEHFGELDTYPFIPPLPDHPHVIPIIKEPDTKLNFGGGWHSDMSYQAKPSMATILYALEVPTHGGDTLFPSMTAAYDALSTGMKTMLGSLNAVFTAAKVHGSDGFYSNVSHPMGKKKDEAKEQARYIHPIVRTHPETGRKALYLDAPHVERFENMRIQESQPLMDFISGHATSPPFTTRFRWQAGSLAIWDNRCVQHYALNDYPGQRREMNRITIKGDVPY
ncbi:MAG: TauD/TfdA family dioxygenase [Myxococcota bacterium]